VITARAFAGKHYAVYGLARSGLATVKSLIASGAKVTAWDANEEARSSLAAQQRGRGTAEGGGGGAGDPPPPALRAATSPAEAREDLTIANLDEADLSQFDSLVVTPGLPLNRHPIVKRAEFAGVEIIGDIELFARARAELPPHKVVGITGTNGKSTTTALIHHILQTAGVPSAMGGNIGLPILAQDPLPEGGIYVLELSSYQIDLTQSLDCDVAVLLNITPDHLDRYESFAAYAKSKMRLFEMQSPSGTAIIVPDRLRSGAQAEAGARDLAMYQSFVTARQHETPALQGPHNAENAAAAMAAAVALGASNRAIKLALSTYPGLPHRMERVREKDGVVFVNDSKATNPTATAPALAAFERIRWICGGQAKTDKLDECAPYFAHVRKAYTIGEAGELFATLLSPHMTVSQCQTLERAVGEAAAEAESGDTVLLSPACASFDQFRDFEERGDRFKQLVGAL
jgi:UDP-N-acetylmuramoylalanine--D-glutamate ligase